MVAVLDQKYIVLGRNGFQKTGRPNAEIDQPLFVHEMTVQILKREHRNTVIVESLEFEKSVTPHSSRVITG